MKRATRAARSFTFGEYAKSMSSLPSILRLRHLPRDAGDELRAAALLEGVGRCRVALQRAREHAVEDGGDPEHVEDQVVLPIRDAGAAGAGTVRGHVLVLGRNAERREVAALEAAEL